MRVHDFKENFQLYNKSHHIGILDNIGQKGKFIEFKDCIVILENLAHLICLSIKTHDL